MTTTELGRYGEEKAAAFLQAKGMRILCRNFRTPGAEVDIVAMDGDCVVFTEVKYRSNTRFGTGVDAITWYKQRRIARGAIIYLSRYNLTDKNARFDVIEVTPRSISHYPNAFERPDGMWTW
jgi:putative endonuclease